MGTQTAQRGNRLVYAMRVTEVLPFERYYADPRFEPKKPSVSGDWRQRCGDNLYYKDDHGDWKQHPEAVYHRDQETIAKDLKYPSVFIARPFYYFGTAAVEIPPAYQSLIRKRQGCKCQHDSDTVTGFLNWLQANFSLGIHGEPNDKDDPTCGGCESK